MVEKESLFGGTTAYSAGVVWIPMSDACAAAGLADSPAEALRYLESEVGAALDRAKAEAYVENAARMLAFLERETHVRYLLMQTWSDYHPGLPGASAGGRSLLPVPYDGRELGGWFAKLRPPIRTMMLFGGMSVSRDDLPHLLNFTRSAASAWHVAGLLARYARRETVRTVRLKRRVDPDEITGSVPKNVTDRCGHSGCNEYVAITCER